MPRTATAFAVLVSIAAPAAADDDRIPGHSVDRPVDGAIQGAALGVTVGAMLIPIRDHDPWRRELFEMDEGVRDNFSPRASAISDGLLAASLAAPAIYLTGSTIDDADGDRLMIYGQAVAINAMLAQVSKRLVQRPRPYTYAKDPNVQRYARDKDDDAYQSFYSGHAALSFGAAVTGAYLLSASDDRPGVRTAAWTAGLTVASTTATLRVRAGKHFYSDVIIGALVGTAVGYAVPALHADDGAYVPRGQEVALAMTGVLGGVLLGRVLPLESRARADAAPDEASRRRRIQISPVPLADGLGLSLGGGW